MGVCFYVRVNKNMCNAIPKCILLQCFLLFAYISVRVDTSAEKKGDQEIMNALEFHQRFYKEIVTTTEITNSPIKSSEAIKDPEWQPPKSMKKIILNKFYKTFAAILRSLDDNDLLTMVQEAEGEAGHKREMVVMPKSFANDPFIMELTPPTSIRNLDLDTPEYFSWVQDINEYYEKRFATQKQLKQLYRNITNILVREMEREFDDKEKRSNKDFRRNDGFDDGTKKKLVDIVRNAVKIFKTHPNLDIKTRNQIHMTLKTLWDDLKENDYNDLGEREEYAEKASKSPKSKHRVIFRYSLGDLLNLVNFMMESEVWKRVRIFKSNNSETKVTMKQKSSLSPQFLKFDDDDDDDTDEEATTTEKPIERRMKKRVYTETLRAHNKVMLDDILNNVVHSTTRKQKSQRRATKWVDWKSKKRRRPESLQLVWENSATIEVVTDGRKMRRERVKALKRKKDKEPARVNIDVLGAQVVSKETHPSLKVLRKNKQNFNMDEAQMLHQYQNKHRRYKIKSRPKSKKKTAPRHNKKPNKKTTKSTKSTTGITQKSIATTSKPHHDTQAPPYDFLNEMRNYNPKAPRKLKYFTANKTVRYREHGILEEEEGMSGEFKIRPLLRRLRKPKKITWKKDRTHGSDSDSLGMSIEINDKDLTQTPSTEKPLKSSKHGKINDTDNDSVSKTTHKKRRTKSILRTTEMTKTTHKSKHHHHTVKKHISHSHTEEPEEDSEGMSIEFDLTSLIEKSVANVTGKNYTTTTKKLTSMTTRTHSTNKTQNHNTTRPKTIVLKGYDPYKSIPHFDDDSNQGLSIEVFDYDHTTTESSKRSFKHRKYNQNKVALVTLTDKTQAPKITEIPKILNASLSTNPWKKVEIDDTRRNENSTTKTLVKHEYIKVIQNDSSSESDTSSGLEDKSVEKTNVTKINGTTVYDSEELVDLVGKIDQVKAAEEIVKVATFYLATTTPTTTPLVKLIKDLLSNGKEVVNLLMRASVLTTNKPEQSSSASGVTTTTKTIRKTTIKASSVLETVVTTEGTIHPNVSMTPMVINRLLDK